MKKRFILCFLLLLASSSSFANRFGTWPTNDTRLRKNSLKSDSRLLWFSQNVIAFYNQDYNNQNAIKPLLNKEETKILSIELNELIPPRSFFIIGSPNLFKHVKPEEITTIVRSNKEKNTEDICKIIHETYKEKSRQIPFIMLFLSGKEKTKKLTSPTSNDFEDVSLDDEEIETGYGNQDEDVPCNCNCFPLKELLTALKNFKL